MWHRYRFETYSVADPRPVVFNPAFPWWHSGTAGDQCSAMLVAWLPDGEPLTKYWPDAFGVESTEHEAITFSSRFPRPAYYREEPSHE